MIRPELLDMLRCPMDRTVRLEPAGDGLACQRCRLEFPVRDGIPRMLVEEAKLPPGCEALADLPCQKAAVAPPGGPA